jgi:hypothetical protein
VFSPLAPFLSPKFALDCKELHGSAPALGKHAAKTCSPDSATPTEPSVRAVSGPLAPDAVQKLNTATQPVLDKLGSSFDYYESRANDRT